MGKLDNYVCDGQMTIFDFIQETEPSPNKLNTPNLSMPWPCRECKWCDDMCCEYDKKPEEYGECKLFVSRTPDFDTMSIEDAAEKIGKECGLNFQKGFRYGEENENAIEYTAKYKKMIINIHFSHFAEGIHGARRFLALDITNERNEGSGSPCISVEEVIEEIKKKIARLKQQEEEKNCKHSGHSCNKEELWKIAKEDVNCPQICCRLCNFEDCGARCNGAERSTYKKKPLVWRMSLTAVYTECPYCHMTNTEKHNTSGTYCGKCMKYFDGEVEKKSKEYIEAEKRRENVDDSREGMV